MRARGQEDGPRSDRESEIVRVKEEGLGAKSQTSQRSVQRPEVRRVGKGRGGSSAVLSVDGQTDR